MLSELIIDFLPAVVGAACIAGILSLFVNRLRGNRKIKALGGWATIVPSKCFGMSFLLRIWGHS